MQGIQSAPTSAIFINEDVLVERTKMLAVQMTQSTGATIQFFILRNGNDQNAFIKDINEVQITPGQERIAKLSERIKPLFHKMMDLYCPVIAEQPLFKQLQEVFKIDDETLRKIIECSSIVLVENFVAACDAEDPQIVDALRQHTV